MGTNAELNAVLRKIRYQHIIPSLMSSSDKHLIRRPKNKQMLENTIRITNIDGEEIQLLPPKREIGQRRRLIREALSLMKNGSDEDWRNLVPLLTKLHRARQTPEINLLDKLLSNANVCGQTSIALDCVKRSKETGVTLTNPRIHATILKGIRKDVVDADWSQEATQKSMSRLRSFASIFERETRDAKLKHETRPQAIYGAVLLELLAMNACKHQDNIDTDGAVKSAAKRLLSSLKAHPQILNMKKWPNPPFNDADELVKTLPFWHGLNRAQQVLKDEMPQADLAKKIISELETRMSVLIGKLEETSPEDGSYTAIAIEDWRKCREA